MTKSPPSWSTEQLSTDAKVASEKFRTERLRITGEWEVQYQLAEKKFETLFDLLDDLKLKDIPEKKLAEAYKKDLGEALRYVAGPPISDDDLKVIADVASIAPSVISRKPKELRKVYSVIERVVDVHRFPWIKTGKTPTRQQRKAALVASAVLLAAQRIATERRNEGKNNQENLVKNYLKSIGFKEVAPKSITTIVRGPQEGEFMPECQLGERKADVVVRLHDTRLLAIECKVSNSATNSVKRLNNDAAVKAKYWHDQFGISQVVPAALLSGVFKVVNLEQAQAQGLSIYWSHDLDKLGRFIESTEDN